MARFGALPGSSSRIVFVYGTRDPWHTGGLPLVQPLRQLNAQTRVVQIEDGSHCADMADDAPDDTKDMLRARAEVRAQLREWLREWPRATSRR